MVKGCLYLKYLLLMRTLKNLVLLTNAINHNERLTFTLLSVFSTKQVIKDKGSYRKSRNASERYMLLES